MATIYGGAGYISSLDVNLRIEEIKERDTCNECGESLRDGQVCSATVTIVTAKGSQYYDPSSGTLNTAPATSLFEAAGGREHEATIGYEEEEELEDLSALKEEALAEFDIDESDWDFGITLTSVYELGESWAKERAFDLGYLDRYSVIEPFVEWDQVAEYLIEDEPYITYKGYSYYYL